MSKRAIPDLKTYYAQRDARTRALLAKAEGLHGPQARRVLDEVILLNQPLAQALARRYRGRGIDDEDLEQVATLGLCKAVRGYRPQPSKTFTAYAVPTITGELKRHFRDCAWLVRPSRSLQEVGQSLRAAVPTLAQSLQRHPSRSDLADFLGVPADTVDQALLAQGLYQGWSLDTPVGKATTPLGDTLADARDAFAPLEAALAVGPAIAQLASRERTILRLRFVEHMTQEQIGRLLGVSQMQISRALPAILAKLRSHMENPRAA